MKSAKAICKNVSKDIKPQAITLASAVLAMQEKIDESIPMYKAMELAQQVTVGTGETMLRDNPAVKEFRATVRDYAEALKNLRAILDEKTERAEVTSLDNIRARLRVAK